MKRVSIGLFSLIIAGLIFVGCQKENINPINNNLQNEQSELATLIKSNLEEIAKELRIKKSDINSKITISQAAENVFSDNPESLKAFQSNYKASINSDYQTYKNGCTGAIAESIQEIETALENSDSYEFFMAFLDTKYNEISASNIQESDKDLLLNHIISYKVSMTFVNENQDLIKSDNVLRAGWWGSWGKCAAGIVGGAGLGALGGAAGGSAVPLIGTVGGGIAGAIFGGLSGAAAAC